MTPNTHISQPPRMTITWQVLEAAKYAGDEMVIAACRRIIVADRRGWKKHGNPADMKLILQFDQALNEDALSLPDGRNI